MFEFLGHNYSSTFFETFLWLRYSFTLRKEELSNASFPERLNCKFYRNLLTKFIGKFHSNAEGWFVLSDRIIRSFHNPTAWLYWRFPISETENPKIACFAAMTVKPNLYSFFQIWRFLDFSRKRDGYIFFI